MTNQEVEKLETMAERFEQEKTNLDSNLKALTTDGAGLLYELKQVVGADSDLGNTISNVGTAVVSASENVFNALSQIKSKMDEKIAEAKAYNAEAESSYSEQNSAISGITFES